MLLREPVSVLRWAVGIGAVDDAGAAGRAQAGTQARSSARRTAAAASARSVPGPARQSPAMYASPRPILGWCASRSNSASRADDLEHRPVRSRSPRASAEQAAVGHERSRTGTRRATDSMHDVGPRLARRHSGRSRGRRRQTGWAIGGHRTLSWEGAGSGLHGQAAQPEPDAVPAGSAGSPAGSSAGAAQRCAASGAVRRAHRACRSSDAVSTRSPSRSSRTVTLTRSGVRRQPDVVPARDVVERRDVELLVGVRRGRVASTSSR